MTNSGFQVETSLFRANDIRGIALGEQTNLAPEFAYHLGRAFGSYLRRYNQARLWLCRDARLSSPELHLELVRGLIDSGIDVLDLGVGPTPLLCHATAMRPAPYEAVNSGVMITASHNPPDHNGFKVIFNDKPFYGDALAQLMDIMATGNYEQGKGKHLQIDHVPLYLDDFQSRFPDRVRSEQKVSVVLDTANGSAGPLAVEALTRIGIDVIPLFCEMDGSFPNHSPDTSKPENLADLADKVRETQAYCGIALDGDGDRMVAVTETGHILNADDMMMLFSKDVLERIPNSTIVFDVKSSNQLINDIRVHGGKPLMTKSGRSYIQAAMNAENAMLAGEFSSHFFFADRWYGSDDGIYAAARLLEICCQQRKPLSEICARPANLCATDEISIPVDEKRKFQLVRDFVANAELDGANQVTIDGLRIEYPAGWALVRASNTSAALTLRFEADSRAELKRLLSIVHAELKKIAPDLDLRKLNVS